MTTDSFKQREQAYEAKYHMDQEINFKIVARRNKLLGLWAAEEMGMAGGGAETYAHEVVEAEMPKGDASVIEKVMADLDNAEVDMTEGRLQIKMNKFAEEAKEQILAEIASGKQTLSTDP